MLQMVHLKRRKWETLRHKIKYTICLPYPTILNSSNNTPCDMLCPGKHISTLFIHFPVKPTLVYLEGKCYCVVNGFSDALLFFIDLSKYLKIKWITMNVENPCLPTDVMVDSHSRRSVAKYGFVKKKTICQQIFAISIYSQLEIHL